MATLPEYGWLTVHVRACVGVNIAGPGAILWEQQTPRPGPTRTLGRQMKFRACWTPQGLTRRSRRGSILKGQPSLKPYDDLNEGRRSSPGVH